jgi:hypothetical protein
MIVLQPLETEQYLKFIARKDTATHLTLRDEQDNTVVEIASDYVVEEIYLSTNVILDLKENRFYNLTIYDNNEIVYRDKVFCTSQINYSINNGEYIQNETNNDYITL